MSGQLIRSEVRMPGPTKQTPSKLLRIFRDSKTAPKPVSQNKDIASIVQVNQGPYRSVERQKKPLSEEMQVALSCTLVENYNVAINAFKKEQDKKDSNNVTMRIGVTSIGGGLATAVSAWSVGLALGEVMFAGVMGTLGLCMAVGVPLLHLDIGKKQRREKLLSPVRKKVEEAYSLLLDGSITSKTAQTNISLINEHSGKNMGMAYPDKAYEILFSGCIFSEKAENVLANQISDPENAERLLRSGRIKSSDARVTLAKTVTRDIADAADAQALLESIQSEMNDKRKAG